MNLSSNFKIRLDKTSKNRKVLKKLIHICYMVCNYEKVENACKEWFNELNIYKDGFVESFHIHIFIHIYWKIHYVFSNVKLLI